MLSRASVIMHFQLNGILKHFPKKKLPGTRKRSKAGAYKPVIAKASPAKDDIPKHVVVVMDGMRGFTTEPLKWALENLIPAGCIVTLLGIMPWLNIPLSSKTWLDVWSLPVEVEDSAATGGQAISEEWRNDVKFLKLKAAFDLCRRYGVEPHKELAMGYPRRLLVVEKTSSLHATWVVFDRHQRKNIEFYMKRIPCKMVMMNGKGSGVMIKNRSLGSSVDSSPFSPVPSAANRSHSPTTAAFLISELLRRILENKSGEENDSNKDHVKPRHSI